MTNLQYESHKDQMDALRRDFQAWWTETGHRLVSEQMAEDEKAAIQQQCWDTWRKHRGREANPL